MCEPVIEFSTVSLWKMLDMSVVFQVQTNAIRQFLLWIYDSSPYGVCVFFQKQKINVKFQRRIVREIHPKMSINIRTLLYF